MWGVAVKLQVCSAAQARWMDCLAICYDKPEVEPEEVHEEAHPEEQMAYHVSLHSALLVAPLLAMWSLQPPSFSCARKTR